MIRQEKGNEMKSKHKERRDKCRPFFFDSKTGLLLRIETSESSPRRRSWPFAATVTVGNLEPCEGLAFFITWPVDGRIAWHRE